MASYTVKHASFDRVAIGLLRDVAIRKACRRPFPVSPPSTLGQAGKTQKASKQQCKFQQIDQQVHGGASWRQLRFKKRNGCAPCTRKCKSRVNWKTETYITISHLQYDWTSKFRLRDRRSSHNRMNFQGFRRVPRFGGVKHAILHAT